jgi:hypothetical protein
VNSIGAVPPPVFQTVPAHSPLGKPPVGIEPVDAPLPPVEASTEAEAMHRRDVIAKQRDDDRQQRGDEDRPEDEPAPEAGAEAEQTLAAQLVLAAQTAPQVATYSPRNLAEFERNSLPPGSLLDQKV